MTNRGVDEHVLPRGVWLETLDEIIALGAAAADAPQKMRDHDLALRAMIASYEQHVTTIRAATNPGSLQREARYKYDRARADTRPPIRPAE